MLSNFRSQQSRFCSPPHRLIFLFYQLLGLEELSEVENLKGGAHFKNFPQENNSPARWRGLAGSTSRKVRSRELASSSTHLCPSSPPASSWLKNHGIVVFSSAFHIIWFHFSEHLWQTSLCLMWAKSWTMDSDRSSSLFSSTWKKTCSIVRAQACKPGSVCLILTNSARRFENTCETCGSPQGASILRHHQGLRSSLPLHHAWLPGKFHALRQ